MLTVKARGFRSYRPWLVFKHSLGKSIHLLAIHCRRRENDEGNNEGNMQVNEILNAQVKRVLRAAIRCVLN